MALKGAAEGRGERSPEPGQPGLFWIRDTPPRRAADESAALGGRRTRTSSYSLPRKHAFSATANSRLIPHSAAVGLFLSHR